MLQATEEALTQEQETTTAILMTILLLATTASIVAQVALPVQTVQEDMQATTQATLKENAEKLIQRK